MHIQAIAFDLDDTLLRDDGSISPRTVEALAQAHSRGIRIFPASGRTIGSVRRAIPGILHLATGLIACNGSEVWSPEGNMLMQELLPVSAAHAVATFAQERDIYCQTYGTDRFYYSRECSWAASYRQLSSLEGECVGDLTTFIRQPVTKLLMMDDPARIAALLKEAQSLYGGMATFTCSKAHFLECNPLRATKGNALRWCASRFGFAMENLLAFGDSLNDLSMLEAAGRGVTVANARPEVKACGFVSCPSNEEDGVAQYIENILD